MRLFSQTPERMLGIDFGTTALRAVELIAGDRPQLLRCCSEPLSEGWVVDRRIRDIPNTAQALERMLLKHGIKTRRSTTAVAFSDAITGTFTVESATREAELEEMVEAEAGRTVTYPLEECSVDFYRTAQPEGEPDHVRFAVCRRAGVEDQVAVLEAAGLAAARVDIDAYSLAMLHSRNPRSKSDAPEALLDLGHVGSRLIIIRGGEIGYTSDLPLGGRRVLEAMRLDYELEPAQAFQALAENRPLEDFSGRVLMPFVDALGNEVSRALKLFYAGAAWASPIDALQIIGGGARLPGIDTLLGRRLGLAVRRVEALGRVDIADRLQREPCMRQLPAFVLAASLALRGTQ